MLRILIVDCDRDTNQMLSRGFESEGWRFDVADGQHEALALLEHNGAYDVVVVEVNLPLPAALGFIREKARRPALARIPVVAITSDVSIPERLEGVVRVLRKPFAIGFAMAALCHAAAYSLGGGLDLPPEALRRS